MYNSNKYNLTDLALGKKNGRMCNLYKYGLGAGIGTTECEIWDDAPNAYHWLDSAVYLDFKSSQAADINAGAGAWSILIQGLGENWELQSETIILNGTTIVTTTKKYIRIFRGYVVEAGDKKLANYGNIEGFATGTSDKVMMIRIGEGQTHMVIYTVPAGRVILIDNADANVGTAKQAIVRFNGRDNTTANGTRLVKATRYLYQNSFSRGYKTARKIPEKTDIWMSAEAELSTIDVSGSFEGRCFDKDFYLA